jgi:hypothetical protein
MNIVSLAKAIGIVFGIVFGIVAAIVVLAILLTKYNALAMLGVFIIAIGCVIGILWCLVMMVYDAIEDKKKGYWD